MAQELLTAFEEILSDKSQNRQAAENHVAELFEGDGKEAAFACLEIAGNHDVADGIRQLAAVLFRRNCFSVMNDEATFWNGLDGKSREEIKDVLLSMVTHWEEDDNIKLSHRICDCITAVVKAITVDYSNLQEESGQDMENYVLPSSQEYWPELLQTLFQLTQGSDAQLEAALYLYSSVPGIFGDQLGEYKEVISELLATSFEKENFEVRVSTANALSGLIGRMKKEEALFFSPLLGTCVNVVREALQDDRVDDAERVLKALVDLTETQPKLFKHHLDEIVNTMLIAAECTTFDDGCRRLALEVCVGLCENAGGMMRKLEDFPTKIFQICLGMIKEIEDDDEWALQDTLATEEDETVLCGEVALDRVATHLGGKVVMEIAVAILPPMLDISSPWEDKYAACIALSSIGEGCYKAMRSYLQDIVALVLVLFKDPNPRVVYAATNVVGQLAVDFAPRAPKDYKKSFAFKFKDEIINALYEVIGSECNFKFPRVQAHATAALVNVVENIRSKDLKDDTETLLNGVEFLFAQKSTIVLESAVTLLATVADSCAEHFSEYYEGFMAYMANIVSDCLSNPDDNKDKKMLLGKTFEASTLMGLAVGKEAFEGDAHKLMEMMGAEIRGMADDAPHANYIHTSCARICQILQEDFEPYLSDIFPPLLRSAKLPSGLLELEEDENIEDLPEGVDAWQQLDIADQRFAIKTSTIEEKRAANDMLIIYCQQLGGKFASQVDEIAQLAMKNLGYYFEENIRISAATIMADLIHSYNENEDYGKPAATQLWLTIYPEFISQTSKEPDLEVMVAKLSGLGRCISELEEDALNEDFLLQLFALLGKIVREFNDRALERLKQRVDDDDFDEEAEVALSEEEEYDYDVIGEVSDLLHLILGYGKEHVKPYFLEVPEGSEEPSFLEGILELLHPDRQPSDLKWAISIFDDIVEHWGDAAIDVSEPFVGPLLGGISHEDPEVRQACVYGIGIMSSVEAFADVCMQSVEKLFNMIEREDARDETNVDATENAISAYIKIGRNVGVQQGVVKEDDLLNQLLEWLPITEDYDEAKYLYGWIVEKLGDNDPIVHGEENLNHLVRVFSQVIGTIVMPTSDDLCKKVAYFLEEIGQSDSPAAAVLKEQLEDKDIAARMKVAVSMAHEDESSA
eukprot:m.21473 g.21473  ORF g.21473 m.21473 type:complete len:1146 (+) comp5354_c0_seq1:170-3607(+)